MSTTEREVAFRRDHLGSGGMPRSSLRQFARRVSEHAPIVVDAYRFGVDPRGQTGVWADYARTRRSTTSLRDLPAPRPNAPHLLVVGLSDQVIDIKLRMAVASALRLHGWRATVLIRSRNAGRVKRYCRAFGVRDFVAYDAIELTREEGATCAQAARELLTGPMDFPSIKAWEFEGAWIGPQLLSTASRRLLEGAPDPTDPAVRAEIELLLPEMLRDVLRARRALQQINPDLAVLDEYNYSVAAPIVDMAMQQGVDIITIRQMFRDDALMPMRLTAQSRRMHHASISVETMQELTALSWTEECERRLEREWAERYAGTRGLAAEYQAPSVTEYDRAGISTELGLDPERPIAVVFSHVLWDANLFYGEDLFDHFGDWLVQTVGAACENQRVNWVIKLHPANLYKAGHHGSSRLNEIELIERHVGTLPEHVHLMYPDARINTLSMYRHTDYGITVRGTPGIEMPCFGKPVLTAGTGRYAGLGFTIDSATPDEYLHRIATIETLSPLTPEQVLRAKWHALALFQMREWTMQTFAPEFRESAHGRWNPLERNLVVTDGALATGQHRDLENLAGWIERGDRFDYLERDELATTA